MFYVLSFYKRTVKTNLNQICQWTQVDSIHPASRGVAAHTAGLFRSVRGAKGGVEFSLSLARGGSPS